MSSTSRIRVTSNWSIWNKITIFRLVEAKRFYKFVNFFRKRLVKFAQPIAICKRLWTGAYLDALKFLFAGTWYARSTNCIPEKCKISLKRFSMLTSGASQVNMPIFCSAFNWAYSLTLVAKLGVTWSSMLKIQRGVVAITTSEICLGKMLRRTEKYGYIRLV